MTAREGRNKTRHVCEKMKEGVAKNTYLRGRWRGGGEEDRGEDRAAEKLSLSEKSSGLSREMETACRR